MKNNSNTLVTILTASLIHEIHIAKTLLASQGINSFIIDENIATSIGTAFVEGYKLNVSTLDFEKATQLLNDLTAENN
ncbi:MAG: hypothetical protein COC16_00235 [Lutibacter sp.]|nr:MAG: hypothetical protein COC16_00235 [Lutibacter sp.]